MSSLGALTSSIVKDVATLSHLLGQQNIPQPSFSESSHNPYKGEDSALRQTRYNIVKAAQDLLRLAQGPEDHILQLAWSSTDTANFGVILRFEVAQNLPLGESIAASDLAAKVGLPEDVLLRSLRYAVGNGLFIETATGIFSHNAASAVLARNPSLRDIALASTHEQAQMLLRLPDTLELQKQKGAEGPYAAFNVVFPQYQNIFECLSKEPALAKRYHLYMMGRVNTDRWSTANMVKSWNWANVGNKAIVDVGGSAGHTCMALAGACPEAKFIIQDVDQVALEEGRQALASMSPALTARTSFVQHDFFQPQTVSADIYIFRHIFHDWSDADTIRILKALVPGLIDGAAVLVSEGIVPAPPATKANTLDEKQILIEDMFMLAVHNGRERSVQDFISLFKQADARYEYVGTTGGVDGAFQSIIEFRFRA
ncbi:putative O-methyltransferase [Hypomontagnella monticulosa]|nr:putative O-methyltransferase [Hypomontagnella monticulosa]